MPLMFNPYSRKPVDVPSGLVGRFRGAGFIEQEPEVVAADKPATPAQRRKRSSNK